VKPYSSRSRSTIRVAVCCCFLGRDLSSKRIRSIDEAGNHSRRDRRPPDCRQMIHVRLAGTMRGLEPSK
jgi:hypothetical protein